MAEITRGDAAALLAQEAGPTVIEHAVKSSRALSLFRNIPMGTKSKTLGMMDVLPTATFVAADETNPAKPTGTASWLSKTLTAEEIAVVVAIPEDVLDDSSVNVTDTVAEACGEAIGRALDAAVFFGTGKPASWPNGLIPAAIAAGATNTVDVGTDLAVDGNNALGLLEALGLVPDGFVAPISTKKSLRGLRGSDGHPIFLQDFTQGAEVDSFYGLPIEFLTANIWTDASANLAAFVSELIAIGVRQDITVKSFDSGVIQASDGSIERNLIQDDAIALRVKARFGFNVATVATDASPTATVYPVAVIDNV